jgi:hypothetical protein
VAYRYELLTTDRAGEAREHGYSSDDPLAPGSVVLFAGRYWLVARVDPEGDGAPPRALAKPARYRIRLRHPDGREELGAFRRFRAGAPRLGHAFATVEDGSPASWQIVEEELAEDDRGEPYLDLVAERDFAELESLPDHELEHALDARAESLPSGAEESLARAAAAGLSVELVALEAGEEPDWAEAERYIDALILEEIEDDLLELCGVRPARDPREAWLDIVEERLQSDLERFRADVEAGHDGVEQWEFRGGRVFAAVGALDDEADPDSGFGRTCRLVDAGALLAAGFRRVRKAELSPDVEP